MLLLVPACGQTGAQCPGICNRAPRSAFLTANLRAPAQYPSLPQHNCKGSESPLLVAWLGEVCVQVARASEGAAATHAWLLAAVFAGLRHAREVVSEAGAKNLHDQFL